MIFHNVLYQDYWKCPKCDELNPPLPRNCNRCWTLRTDWLPENETDNAAATTPADTPAESASDAKPLPPKPTLTDSEEGLDVPDGCARSALPCLRKWEREQRQRHSSVRVRSGRAEQETRKRERRSRL